MCCAYLSLIMSTALPTAYELPLMVTFLADSPFRAEIEIDTPVADRIPFSLEPPGPIIRPIIAFRTVNVHVSVCRIYC